MRHTLNRVSICLLMTLAIAVSAAAAAGTPKLLEPHHDHVVAARFNSDGTRTISLDDSGQVVEWDFKKQRIIASARLRELRAGNKGILSSDGRYALLSDSRGHVTLHDLKKKSTKTIPCSLLPNNGKESRSVAALAMNDDATLIILADNYNNLYRSEKGGGFTPIGTPRNTYVKHSEPHCMALSPDGRMVVVSSDAQLRGFDTKNGAEVRYFAHKREGWASSINFSPDGRYLTAAMPIRFSAGVAIGEFPVWEVASGKLAHSFDLDDGLPFYAGFSRDGRYLFTGASRLCSVVDLQSGRQIVKFSPDQASTNRNDMRESPDGRYLLVAGLKGQLLIYDYRQLLEGKTPPVLASLESQRTSVAALAFSADGATLAITHNRSNAVQLFDLKSRTLARQIKGNAPYSRLRFSTDGARLTGAAREEIAVWRYPSLEPVGNLKRRYTPQLLFSPDGNRALAMDNQLWANGNSLRGDRLSEVTEYDLVNAREVRSTLLKNINTGANVYHLLCVDFDKQIAAFKLYSAFVYSLKDGSLLREVKMPKAPESEWLTIWEGKWRFDCDRLDFVPASPDLTNTPADWQRDHAESANSRTRVRIDSLEDATVTIYDNAGKQRNSFKTIATPWDRENRSSAVALSPDGSLLAVGTELGDVALYDAAKGKELGRYIYFSDGEWSWVAPDGTVNGSEAGMSRLEMLKE